MKSLFLVFALIFVSEAEAGRRGRKPRFPELTVCSFNIQFLGSFANRDNEGLARLTQSEKCDIVVIQELNAAPAESFLDKNYFPFQSFPDSTGRKAYPMSELLPPKPITPSPKSTVFFQAMAKAGFKSFILSPENTGPQINRVNSSAAEWWVTFYKKSRVNVATDLPHGFLSDALIGEREFERTPYAFPFRTKEGNFDFVLISVHLMPGDGPKQRARRAEELKGIYNWVDQNSEIERDYIILGDMNIEDKKELDVAQMDWLSLNDACVPTNTNPKPDSAKPYDHVMINPYWTTEYEIPSQDNFTVVDLRHKMAKRWAKLHPGEPYPGGTKLDEPGNIEGYVHDRFRTEYSDHHLVKFKITVPRFDDDY